MNYESRNIKFDQLVGSPRMRGRGSVIRISVAGGGYRTKEFVCLVKMTVGRFIHPCGGLCGFGLHLDLIKLNELYK